MSDIRGDDGDAEHEHMINSQEHTQALRTFLQRVWRAKRKAIEGGHHLADAVLYDLALDELEAARRAHAKHHLSECPGCVSRLTTFQRAIASERAVHAVWEPQLLYAAGDSDTVPVIAEPTTDGKYEITLQPTTEGARDLLTLAVTPAYRDSLEGATVVVVSVQGTVVLRGMISGGNVAQLVPRALRAEWPFSVHAG